jgi:hypothetical protein
LCVWPAASSLGEQPAYWVGSKAQQHWTFSSTAAKGLIQNFKKTCRYSFENFSSFVHEKSHLISHSKWKNSTSNWRQVIVLIGVF